MLRADWYFDFVSPFAYLQFKRLHELDEMLEIRLRPVLFAGLLQHHGMLGPAEIPSKRVFTYRFVQWYARANAIAFCMPPAHPFNPLQSLRLCSALGADRDVVAAIFDVIWAEGLRPDSEAGWRRICERLEIEAAETLCAQETAKTCLHENFNRAVEAGVFGVPSFVLDGTLFWGLDATPMLKAFIADPDRFEDDEMRRVSTLPQGVQRRR